MHRAKEGEGYILYRVRVREREGKRKRDGEWERETHTIWSVKHQLSTDHPTVLNFFDLWGHTYLNKIFAYS